MKKNQIAFLLVILVTVFLVGFGAAFAEEKDEEIRIGILAEMTGFGADYGPKFLAVQKLYLQQVGNKIAGKPLKIIVEDSGTTPAMAIDKVRKMIGVDKVHMIAGTIFGHITQTISTVAAEAKIPHIMWFGGHYEAIERGWSFGTTLPLESTSYIAGQYAYELGYRTATSLGQDYVAGHKINGGAMQGFIDSGGEVIQKQWPPLGTADFAPYISTLKPADVAFVWLAGTPNLVFWKQYDQFGHFDKMPIVIPLGDTIFSEWLLKLDPNTFAGKITGTTGYTSDLDNPMNKKFVAAFRDKMRMDPDAYDELAYELWLLIQNTLEATNGDTDPGKLREAIRGLEMQTPAGPVRISEKGFAYRPTYVFELAVKDGELYKKRIKEFPEIENVRLRKGISP
jgi:branched-chain amino acid transport system substrate-binding protein